MRAHETKERELLESRSWRANPIRETSDIRKPDITFLGLCRLAQTFLLLLQAFINLCKFEKDKKKPKKFMSGFLMEAGRSQK